MSVDERIDDVSGLLRKVYPRCLTTSEISARAGIPSCSLPRVIRGSLSRKQIVLAGKKGRENCYRAVKK
jgi:predicted transcriptional regulator